MVEFSRLFFGEKEGGRPIRYVSRNVILSDVVDLRKPLPTVRVRLVRRYTHHKQRNSHRVKCQTYMQTIIVDISVFNASPFYQFIWHRRTDALEPCGGSRFLDEPIIRYVCERGKYNIYRLTIQIRSMFGLLNI